MDGRDSVLDNYHVQTPDVGIECGVQHALLGYLTGEDHLLHFQLGQEIRQGVS